VNNLIISVTFRPNFGPHAHVEVFSHNIQDSMNVIQHENKPRVFKADMNIDLLKYDNNTKNNEYFDAVSSCYYLPVIIKSTRL